MAAGTTSNLSNLLIRVYSRRDWFAPFERKATVFWDSVQEFDNEEPLGVGRYFEIWLQDPHNTGATAESGDLPSLSQPVVVQGNVAAIQISAAFGLSELLLSAGQRGGVFGSDVLHRHVETVTRNLMSNINRLTVAGHGTGRLAVIDATTSAVATFVARVPEHVLQLRNGMKIDFFDVDSSGSKQGATQTINFINFDTRTVTIDASRSLTAGWGVYQALSTSVSTYGVAPNGMRGIVDDGTLAATIFGQTRASFPDLNAQVLASGSGGLGTQPYSEKLVRKGINRVYFTTGADVDEIWCNRGVIGEHLNHLIGDRIYTVGTGENNVPKYRIGYDLDSLGFQFKGRLIPFKVDEDIPSREMYLVTKSLFRRHVLRPATWVGDESGVDGSANPILMQLPSSSGGNYSLAKIAGMVWMGNIAHLMPKATCLIKEISDEELAGDSVN
jgi:hypothetical protein